MGSSASAGPGPGATVQPARVEMEMVHNSDFDDLRLSFLHGTLEKDPACPLDECQLYSIAKTWQLVKRQTCGLNLFMRLFEMYPDTKGYFSAIKSLPTIAEIRSSELLAVHANKVIGAIDDVINNINDVEYVTLLLRVLARSHFSNLPDFDSVAFKIIEEPFILAVKEELLDKFTYSTELTYRTAIRFALNALMIEFNTVRANHKAAAKPNVSAPSNEP